MLRIVATADNHLGRYYDRMPPARLEERRRYLRRCFSTTVDLALERQAHLFLQLGDLFDTPEPRNAERLFVAQALSRLREGGVRTFAIGGNHDTARTHTSASASSPQTAYVPLGGLHLLEPAGPDGAVPFAAVECGGLRVAIGGLGWDPTLGPGADPLAAARVEPPAAAVRLLLAHYCLDQQPYSGALEPVVARATLDAIEGIDHFLFGHIHRHRRLDLGRDPGDRTATMVGATERMTFGAEEGEPGFVYLEIGADARLARFEFVPTPSQPRREVTIAAAELGADPTEAVLSRLAEIAAPDCLVKLRLAGVVTREVYHRLDPRRILEVGAERCFHLDLETDGLLLEGDLARQSGGGIRFSPTEELRRCADEALALAADDPERELIQEARDLALERYAR